MLRFLFCSLSSPGFLYPAIGIAEQLRKYGHQVAFVTDVSAIEILARRQLFRYSRGPEDGPSFQVELWGQLLSIIIQVKHVEYAIADFCPDVIVGQQLTLGPLIAAERNRLPIAVIGLATYLWPSKQSRGCEARGSTDDHQKQYEEMVGVFNEARSAFRLPPYSEDLAEYYLAGSLFLLRSIPDLEGSIENRPEQVHFAGACLWDDDADDPELREWLAEARAMAAPIIYVQHGRFFDSPHFWPALVTLASERDLWVGAATGRMDALAGKCPKNIFVRRHLSQSQVLRAASAMLASANTTAVLGALTIGVPAVLVVSGGEQPCVANRCLAAGVARALTAEEASPERIWAELNAVMQDRGMSLAAKALARRFSRIDSFPLAAGLLIKLAGDRLPVLRAAAS